MPTASREELRRTAGRFLELLGAMKRYVREELSAGPGLSEEKFRSLLSLRRLGGGSLKALAAQDGLSASAQCIMLNRLVEEGLAARSPNPKDRRGVHYALTASGKDLLSAEIARRSDLLGARLRCLSESRRARFARAVETLLDDMAALKEAPEKGAD